MQYLDFNKISQEIPFKTLLDNLNIPYSIKGNYLKGKYKEINFVVELNKNIFVNTNNKNQNGSVINFLALITGSSLRGAAEELQSKYLVEQKEPKREIPTLSLVYHNFLENYGISRETAQKMEVGLVKSKSIFAGKLAFRCYDNGNPIGYVAYDHKEDKWIFPKFFKRTLYNFNQVYPQVIVCCNPFDCVYFVGQGIENIVCIIGKSMTESQTEELKKFDKVLLLHKEPENIMSRLMNNCFVKAPVLIKSVNNYTAEEMMSFF